MLYDIKLKLNIHCLIPLFTPFSSNILSHSSICPVVFFEKVRIVFERFSHCSLDSVAYNLVLSKILVKFAERSICKETSLRKHVCLEISILLYTNVRVDFSPVYVILLRRTELDTGHGYYKNDSERKCIRYL